MIHVKMFNNGYTVTGHANSDEAGRDIVCASVSSITQATLGGLLYYAPTTHIMTEGYLSVSVEKLNDEARALIHTVSLAMNMLSTQYPQYIEYERVEEDNTHE